MIKPQITSIHFQLTGRCNLRCIFCGQQNGMFGGCLKDREIPPQKWFEIADSLRGLSPKPEIVLWGGEPLLYEQFDELARHLHDSGFELGIITNGTLIDRHAELLNRCFKTIYISLDGDAPYHNRIRGKGVFERVAHNVSLLKNRSGRLIFLSTLADENVDSAPGLPLILGKLGPDLIHLQRLMYFTRAEIERKISRPLRFLSSTSTAHGSGANSRRTIRPLKSGTAKMTANTGTSSIPPSPKSAAVRRPVNTRVRSSSIRTEERNTASRPSAAHTSSTTDAFSSAQTSTDSTRGTF